jgi:glutamate synthase (NADPH/NADH) large chain
MALKSDPDRHPSPARSAGVSRRPTSGLYQPRKEHDSCGVGFVASLNNKPGHHIIEKGLEILVNLEHRGAVGADPLMGDGAGILVQVPHDFFHRVTSFDLPGQGEYAVAMVFYPQDEKLRRQTAERFRRGAEAEGLELIGTRAVPFDNSGLSEGVVASQPVIEQIFLRRPDGLDGEAFERKLLIARKVISN